MNMPQVIGGAAGAHQSAAVFWSRAMSAKAVPLPVRASIRPTRSSAAFTSHCNWAASVASSACPSPARVWARDDPAHSSSSSVEQQQRHTWPYGHIHMHIHARAHAGHTPPRHASRRPATTAARAAVRRGPRRSGAACRSRPSKTLGSSNGTKVRPPYRSYACGRVPSF
jgi:hypothetical protein